MIGGNRGLLRVGALAVFIAGTVEGRMQHDQVHMNAAEVDNVDLVASHHKGFGPDEIDV